MQNKRELRQESRIVSGFCVTMVALAFTVLLLRWLFGTGLIWLQETVLWLHAALFLAGGYLACRENGHIRIDLFAHATRRRRFVDRLGHVLFLVPMMSTIVVGSLGPVSRSWQQWERSAEAGGLPGLFLLKSLLPLAASAVLLWAVLAFFRDEGEA